MLLAFINPSGPTREPQELAVLLINIGHIRVFSAAESTCRLCGEYWSAVVQCQAWLES